MKLCTWAAIVVTLGSGTLAAARTPAQPGAPGGQKGVEVLARGPVHEAFAMPSQDRPWSSPIIPKEPPPPIEELPPNEKPAGDQVLWIPGYWAWDDEQKDYLWISGCWRVPPPNRQWVPGNWQHVEGGWQWTSGFWAPTNQNEMYYLPAPPPSIDAGPSMPAPNENSMYVPGSWVYRAGRYLWRPGFWLAYQPGWVWVPCQYVWTPAGYVFVDGHWDRALEWRGLLFAPVRVPHALWGRQWTYVPRYVVQPDFLFGALFVRPLYGHYYFGDYFQPRYERHGFIPWFDYRIGRASYDPNFIYYRHYYRNQDWERNLRAYYAGRANGAIPRPPHTLVQQNKMMNTFLRDKIENIHVNKNIHISQMQNIDAITPVTKMHNRPVTGLAALRSSKGDVKKVDYPTIKVETLPKEHQDAVRQAVIASQAAALRRRQAEAKILAGSGAPLRANDLPHTVKLQPPRIVPIPPRSRAPQPVAPLPPAHQAPPPRPHTPPPPPKMPAHVAKPIPWHQPPKPARPPKK